jgi:hypothetical protein
MVATAGSAVLMCSACSCATSADGDDIVEQTLPLSALVPMAHACHSGAGLAAATMPELPQQARPPDHCCLCASAMLADKGSVLSIVYT